MAFRADEAAREEYESAFEYLITRCKGLTADERQRSIDRLMDIVDELGPVIRSYPTWHPLVSNYHVGSHPVTYPSRDCGYMGLDHTVTFQNGFITCPYDDGQRVIDSVKSLPSHRVASVTAERLDVKFYNTQATAILVRCHWDKSTGGAATIPLSIALPLLLEKELAAWERAEVAETWESMRPYFLGRPHGSRSSLFVDQEAGQKMKAIWNLLINTGMYGPIYVGP